jgi:hypothetical protein
LLDDERERNAPSEETAPTAGTQASDAEDGQQEEAV